MATIKDYQDAYNRAKAKGDTKGMSDAHAGAEKIRASQGYSGGADGSQRISLSGSSVETKLKKQYDGRDVTVTKSGKTGTAGDVGVVYKTLDEARDKVKGSYSYYQNKDGTVTIYEANQKSKNYKPEQEAVKQYLKDTGYKQDKEKYSDFLKRGISSNDMSAMDSSALANLSKQYAVATTQEEKNFLHNKANEIRAKYGIDGGVDGSGTQAPKDAVKQDLVTSILDSANIDNSILQDPTASELIDKIAELATINYQKTENTIRQQEQDALREQSRLERDTDRTYDSNVDTLNTQEYQTLERNRLLSSRRGIGNSQQMAGLEQGIQGKYASLRFENEQDRAARLQDIKDRIASIKQNANTNILNAQLGMQADVMGAQIKELEAQRDYELKVSLAEMQRSWDVEDREDKQLFESEKFMQAFEQDLIKMGIEQQQKKEIMALDNSYKVALARMDIAARERAAKADNAKLGAFLEVLKMEQSENLPPEQMTMQVRSTLTGALNSLTDTKTLNQFLNTGEIPGVGLVDLEVYKKVTGKSLINDVKYLVKDKTTNTSGSEAKDQSSIFYKYIPPTNLALLTKNFDTKYYNKTNEVNSMLKELTKIQAMEQGNMISDQQALDMLGKIIGQ